VSKEKHDVHVFRRPLANSNWQLQKEKQKFWNVLKDGKI
jgi:hypothetical protein